MSRNTHHIINKPILATAPNERWAIDLVDMNRYQDKNKEYRYILTCIDHFSRYVWARPLKLKESQEVTEAMQDICSKAGVYCKILMRDNGKEFDGHLTTWIEEHNITGIKTLSYSPQSNGLIENFNNQLRKMLRELMIRNKNLVWYNKLDLCCSIKNKQKNGTTKQRPIDIWNDLPYETQNKDLHLPVAQRIKAKAKKNVLKNKTQEFTVGDYVRVKLSQLYSQIRQMVKQGDKKYIVVKYSPEIYEIDRILKPDHEGYEKLRYTLKDLDGNILLTQQKMNNPNKPREQKRFFASDFLKVNKEDIPNDVVKVDDKNHVERDGFDIHQALKLNVIKDAETEAKKPKPPKKVTVKKEKAPVVLREPSARTRTPSTRLVYPSEVEQPRRERVVKEKAPVILREPTARTRRPSSRLVYPSEVEGSGFVLIGGQKHLLF
jgi:transposase InsO family protein